MIVRVRLSTTEFRTAREVLLGISAIFAVFSISFVYGTPVPEKHVTGERVVAPVRSPGEARPPIAPKLSARSTVSKTTTCGAVPAQVVGAVVARAAQQHNIDHRVLTSMVHAESGSRACAVSAQGAAGLMQLMPATASHFGVRNVYDPQQNIEAGTRYLKTLLERYHNNLPLALAAYNAGPGAVDSHGGIPPYPETRRYVSAVMRASSHPTKQ